MGSYGQFLFSFLFFNVFKVSCTEYISILWLENNNKYFNLWSINNDRTGINTPVVKTIYDPCPVGFKIPESDAFTGFTHENSIWNSDFAEKNFFIRTLQ